MFVLQLESAAAFVSVIAPPISPPSAHPFFFSSKPTVEPFCHSDSWWNQKENATHPKPSTYKSTDIDRTLVEFLLVFHPLKHAWNMESVKSPLCSCWNHQWFFFFFLYKNLIQHKVFHLVIVACHLCFHADVFDIWYPYELLCRQVEHKNGKRAEVIVSRGLCCNLWV